MSKNENMFNANSHEVIEHGYHKDWYDIREGDVMNTAIFYFNTCDGYTKIKTIER